MTRHTPDIKISVQVHLIELKIGRVILDPSINIEFDISHGVIESFFSIHLHFFAYQRHCVPQIVVVHVV